LRIGVLELLQAHIRAARIAQQPAHGRAARFDAFRAGEADKRIAPEALPADHRLEEIRVGPVRQLGVDSERRVEVGAGLDDDGDLGIALRCELAEFWFCHDCLPLQLPWDYPGTSVRPWCCAPPSRAETR